MSDNESPPYNRPNLATQLEWQIDEYRLARERYWQNRTEGSDWDRTERIRGYADHLAEALVKSTEALVSAEASGDEKTQFECERSAYLKGFALQVESLFKPILDKVTGTEYAEIMRRHIETLKYTHDESPPEGTLVKLVWEQFCITLASETAGEGLRSAANRLLRLTALVIQSKPSERTLGFLRRVSRCFVWGFDTECAVLCRGVMDTIFKDAVDDELCQRQGEVSSRCGYVLTSRIHAAFKSGMIDGELKRAALRINSDANNLLHQDSNYICDVLENIQDTLSLVTRLSQSTP
jgi:hypothetical protein